MVKAGGCVSTWVKALFGILAGAIAISGLCSGPAAGAASSVAGMNASRATSIGSAVPLAAAASGLTVTKAGSGSGTIESDIGAISCGATCSDSFADGTPITLTATPAAGNQFTGWLGPCTGVGTCQLTIGGPVTVSATFAPAFIAGPVLDIDGTGDCDALTDGLLIVRYLSDVSDAALINNAVGVGATRTDATEIADYLADIRPALDIDGNGQVDAMTDGVLITRHLFGLRGASLIAGAVGAGATRTTAADIDLQMQSVLLAATPAGITSFTATRMLLTAGSSTTLTPGFAHAAFASIDQGVGAVASGTGYLVSPAVTTTYTLTLTGVGGPVTQSLTITVVPAAHISSFTATAPSVISGNSTQLNATFSGGTASIDHGIGAITSGVSMSTGALVSATTYTLTVTNAAGDSVTASAAVAINYQVSFGAGAGGSLGGSTSQAIAAGGDCSAVTAVPNANYGFLNWTGTGFTTSAANPLTVSNVTQNLSLTANFQPLPVIGSFSAASYTIGKGQAANLIWSGLLHGTSASIDNGGGTIALGNSSIQLYPVVTTTYTLTLTNAVGATTSSLTITVVPPPVVNSFTASPTALAAGQSTTLSWDVTGATSLSINNGVGTVTGTSVNVVPPVGITIYRLTAQSIYGTVLSAPATVNSGPPVALTYSTNPATYNMGIAITPNTPSNAGGPIDGGYIVIPALPLGLTLDPGTGVITGTPTFTSATNTYTVRGTNSTYGFTQVGVVITVRDTPPLIGYSSGSYAFELGVPVSLTPVNTGGAVVTWTIAPALPAGLNFNTATGQITGTPSTIAAAQSYTIAATNTGGASSVSLTLSVVQTPPSIAYASGSYAFYVGTAITTLVPANTGGPVVTWAINPALPAGLDFDTSNGRISGTPTAVAAAQNYTVSATNLGGTCTASPSISVAVHAPVITVQPYGQILSPGAIPGFSVTATGTGALGYQWYRDGIAIGGATDSSYTAPAFAVEDDGAVFTVVVSDTFGGSTTSDPAVLSLFEDLTTWLSAHPAIAAAIKWQFQPAGASVYQAPAETDKIAWANWSLSQKADLNQAYLDAVSWYSQGAPQVTMIPGGATLNDQPTNLHPSVGDDNSSTLELVSPAYLWKLYVAHVAFSLMLEVSHQVPWSVEDYPDTTLKWIFDSATMGWYLNNGNFYMGTYESAGLPDLRTNNRPRTTFADPRWTYHWLRQAGIVGSTRLATIGRTLDWMRLNMTHFYGSETFGTDAAVWQYRGYSPISQIVNGTVDSRNPGLGTRHWTAGCHGSTGFLSAALRVVNVPVQPIFVCGHELVYFMSEDLYMDHADDPYNGTVRASSTSSLMLLIDSATWRSRFGNDETINILDDGSPACAWIGYTAANFH